MSRVQEYSDAMFYCFPAPSYEEIARRLRPTFPRITEGIVNNTLHWVRKNPELAGYNVGYVKRGVIGAGDDENRFFVINKDDPTFKFSDTQRDHFDDGLNTNIKGMETFASNMAEMMETAMVHEELRVNRRYLSEMADIVGYCARQTRRIYNIMQDKRSA